MYTAEPMFRFAHLSDPHLTDPSGASARELAGKRALGYLSWLRRRRHEHRREFLEGLAKDLHARSPDHTVVTGDLTHISLPQEFLEARAWLSSIGSGDRVTVVPGNHDAYVQMPWESALGQWTDYMQTDVAQPASGTPFPIVRVRGQIAFIGLNSAVPTPALFATGKLGESQMRRLEDTLAALDDSGLLRVLLIHHPPVPGTEKWRKRLIDAPVLCRLLERTPVDIVLHGHQHRPGHALVRITDREIPVFGIPSASAAGLHCAHASTYNEYDVSLHPHGFRVDVKARRWHHETEAYVEEPIASLDITRD
jgi:3',5'-cyclic AMP phosphodiesterase CpdA